MNAVPSNRSTKVLFRFDLYKYCEMSSWAAITFLLVLLLVTFQTVLMIQLKYDQSASLYTQIECRDPSWSDLSDQLAGHQLQYYQNMSNHVKRAAMAGQLTDEGEKIPGQLVDHQRRDLFENTQCDLISVNNQNATRELATCPWRYERRYRRDRFPLVILEAVCKCEKCITFSRKGLRNYKCMPILRPHLALERSNACDGNRVWMWRPVVEMINHGCTCGFAHEVNPKRTIEGSEEIDVEATVAFSIENQ